MNDIENKIKKIVSEQLGVPIDKIENHHGFIADLGGDSLDTVEMLLELEDRFGVEVDEDTAENLHTVQSVIDFVNSKITA